MATLLERAGVQPPGPQIVGRSVDDFTVGFPTEYAFDGRDALVAVGMNGEPLPAARVSGPADRAGSVRLRVGDQVVVEIELVRWDGFDGYWVPRGWRRRPHQDSRPASTSPPAWPRDAVAGRRSPASPGPPGAGAASRRVELRVDDGDRGMDAELAEAIGEDTWRQWRFVWDASPGEHQLGVRATDRTGDVQDGRRVEPRPDGATGFHAVRVLVS